MTEQDPVEGRQRETNLEIMTEQDPVEGRQRETNLEIMTKQDSRRETKADKPGNHVVTKSVSLQELRTPSAEAVWGTTQHHHQTTQHHPKTKKKLFTQPSNQQN